MLCTRCKKRQAIVFVQRMEGSETKNEGYCLTCARELHIKPLDDMMQRFGVSDQDLEGMEERMNDFMKEMGENGQMPEGMFPMPTEEPDGDGEDGEDGFTPGGSPVFPFGFGSRQKKEDEEGEKGKKGDRKPKKRKFLTNYCEDLTGDGQHVEQKHISGFVRTGEFQTDKYIKKSDGPEEWTPQFVYHGFRYVEAEGLPEELPGPCIMGLVMHTSFERTGHFECSDDTLMTIQRLCHWSSISNCQGVPTDCPHREKNAWTGDAGPVHDQLLLNYDAFLFLEKWLDDLCQSQRPNGSIPCVCPSTGWGYNWGNGPDWSMVLTTLPWALYEQTGDAAILARYYPFICRHFDFMSSMAVDGIVNYGIGDWCAPFDGPAISVNMSTFKAPVALTDTACYYRSARMLSKMSRVLGLDDPYLARSEEIRAALLRNFVDADTGEVAGACQTSDGCVAFHHLLKPQEEARLMERLAERIAQNGWHIDYGILGSKYVLNMLGEYGRTDVIYKMLTREDYPGYLYWVDHGCTTLAECWNLGGSHNHYMFSDVSAVFYRYFAGIRPDGDIPAYRSFLLAPALDLAIDTLSCSVESPHGTIFAGWKKDGDTVTFTAGVPFGTTARLRLPAGVQAPENGAVLDGGRHEFCWKIAQSAG